LRKPLKRKVGKKGALSSKGDLLWGNRRGGKEEQGENMEKGGKLKEEKRACVKKRVGAMDLIVQTERGKELEGRQERNRREERSRTCRAIYQRGKNSQRRRRWIFDPDGIKIKELVEPGRKKMSLEEERSGGG